MGVRNLPKVFTRQRPGRESNPVSAIRKSDALPVSHRATIDGIFANTFLPFSQNRLECSYGLFAKHGRRLHCSWE